MTVDFQPHSLGAFRGCCHGDAISYRATLESSGPIAVETLLRQLRSAQLIATWSEFPGEMRDSAASRPDYYAVLDIVDDKGCWADNLAIPTKTEFDTLRETLGLRIKSTDCDEGCE